MVPAQPALTVTYMSLSSHMGHLGSLAEGADVGTVAACTEIQGPVYSGCELVVEISSPAAADGLPPPADPSVSGPGVSM